MFQERGTVCGCCLSLKDLKPHRGMQRWALPCPSQLPGGVCSSALSLCPPKLAASFTPKLLSPQFLHSTRSEGETPAERSISVCLQCSSGWSRAGKGPAVQGGLGCMWGQVRGHAGAVTAAEEAGPAQHLMLLPLGRAGSSLPS